MDGNNDVVTIVKMCSCSLSRKPLTNLHLRVKATEDLDNFGLVKLCSAGEVGRVG